MTSPPVINELAPCHMPPLAPLLSNTDTRDSPTICFKTAWIFLISPFPDPSREAVLHGGPWSWQLGKFIYWIFSDKNVPFYLHNRCLLTCKGRKCTFSMLCPKRVETKRNIFIACWRRNSKTVLNFSPLLMVCWKRKEKIQSCSNLNYLSLHKSLGKKEHKPSSFSKQYKQGKACPKTRHGQFNLLSC